MDSPTDRTPPAAVAPAASAAAAPVDATATTAMQETSAKIQTSLIPAVKQLLMSTTSSSSGSSSSAAAAGLDFLHVKNTVMLSYLIEWIMVLRDRNERQQQQQQQNQPDDETDTTNATSCRRRLLEIKTVLDKSRGLDKKLRYQIDKLLASASASSSSAFASGSLPNKDSHDGEDDNENHGSMENLHNTLEDPLQFRPDPRSLFENSEDDGRSASSNSSSDDSDQHKDAGDLDGEDEDDYDDDDLAAARQTLALSSQTSKKLHSKKHKKSTSMQDEAIDSDGDDSAGWSNRNSQVEEGTVYRAPRLTAVPYTHDEKDRRLEKEKRQRRRLRASELAQTLRDQYGDAPDQEDIHGGGNSDMYGKQRAASKKLAQLEAERTEYEESAMIRLMTSRKEKKEKMRIKRMMEGGSNLAQIANLGNLVRETEEFGRGGRYTNDGDGDDGEEEARRKALVDFHKSSSGTRVSSTFGPNRHPNGKRKRDRGDQGMTSSKLRPKKGRRNKPKNSLQAALYGN